jgi:hypothetical protein
MTNRSLFVLWILTLVLTGCAGLGQVARVSDLSVEQLRQMHGIQIHESEKDLKYKSLGQIKGISCKGSAWSGNTMQEAAMTQLKIKATKINANAILYPTCSHDASVDWGNNCWESWVCVAEAAVIE